MKRLLTLMIFVAFPAMATTYTAASNAESDVQAAINLTSSAGGDTVQIPCSGTQSVVWTGTLASSNNFTLTALGGTPNSGTGTFGAGTNCLTIRDNNTSSNYIMYFTPTYQAGQALVIQNINIDPYTGTTPLTSPIGIQGTCTSSGCPQIREDNLIFGNAVQWNETGNSSSANWMTRCDNVFGVLDHNTQPNGSTVDFVTCGLSGYLGVGDYGDNSWAQPDSFGGANALYLENNIIYTSQETTDCEKSPSSTSQGGCRLVGRYNQIYSVGQMFVAFSFHGLDTSGRVRGGRQLEAYNNTITCTGTGPSIGGGCGGVASFRGGTGYVFGNTLISNYSASGGYFNNIFGGTVYRIVYWPSTWGGCGGLTSVDPWDTQDNTVYYSGTITAGAGLTMTDTSKSWTTNQFIPNGAPYSVYDTTQGTFVAEIASNTATTITIQAPISESTWTGFNIGDHYEIIRATVCGDQMGRGQGIYISGATPSVSSPLNEALDPIYEWNDTVPRNLNGGNGGSDTLRVIENRDYYTDKSNGAPIAQTSASVPFNGTTTCNAGASNYSCGVGFGTLARRPTTCSPSVGYFATDAGSQGTLYTCQTTNNWTVHYTPYTYPHPLTNGTSGSSGSPQPPTNLSAIVN